MSAVFSPELSLLKKYMYMISDALMFNKGSYPAIIRPSVCEIFYHFSTYLIFSKFKSNLLDIKSAWELLCVRTPLFRER